MKGFTTSVRIGTAIVITALVVACGGSSKSPVAPSSGTPAANGAPTPPTTGIVTGASIDGTVVGVSGGSSLGVRPMSGGATVSVMGANVSSPVDASGRFSLKGVPSGDVQLLISGGGISATLTISGVSDHEQIHITIQVTGSGASADDTDREDADNRAEVEGKITAIVGNTITVAGKVVTIPAGTPIHHGGTAAQFSDLHLGDRVHVHGTVTGGGITATDVELQTANPGNPGPPTPTPGNGNGDDHGNGEAEVSGAVAAKGGTCPSITFSVGATKVATDSKTQFKDTSCTALANGDRVEVKGTKQSNGTVLASKVERDN